MMVPRQQVVRISRIRRELLRFLQGIAYLSPVLVLFGVFIFYPLVRSIILSTFKTDLLGRPYDFVGIAQYRQIFNQGFGRSLIITLEYALITVVPEIILSLMLAVMASWSLRGIGLFRLLFSSPIGIAVASSSVMFKMLYSPNAGVFNYLLRLVGGSGINWLTNPKWALMSVAIVTLWRQLGYDTLHLLSGIQSIPAEIHESARLDGAGPWAMFWKITLPMLSPVLMFITITSTIAALQSFGPINILTEGGPAGATRVVVYSLFREAFFNYNFGLASAQAIVLFLIVLVLTLLQFRRFERSVFYQ
jgi:sn-glycerol 3-phosphate transport system permease protein